MALLAGSIVTDIDLTERFPKGLVVNNTASGASPAMASTGAVVTLPSTSETITNNDSISRDYVAHARVRVSMVSGTNGLYRPLITDGATTAVGGGTEQILTNVTGGGGQVGGNTFYPFTLAPAASITVAAGGLRAAGGGTSDTFVAGVLIVIDLGASA